MRIASFVILLLALAAPARAQETEPCHPVSPTKPVIVTTKAGQTIQGTLLCLSQSEVLLAGAGQFSRTPLDSVLRISTQSDPVWDGALKGAAIPLVAWAVFCRCDFEHFARPTLAYALIGLTWDALQTNRKTLYRGNGRSASVAWRVRF